MSQYLHVSAIAMLLQNLTLVHFRTAMPGETVSPSVTITCSYPSGCVGGTVQQSRGGPLPRATAPSPSREMSPTTRPTSSSFSRILLLF